MKLLKLITCIVLVVSMFATAVMPVAAARATYYLSDLKLAEADTEEEAKQLLTAAGYTVFDQNLNPGGSKAVYLGYKKSTNVDDAITDVRVMNMNGGFNITDYETIKKNALQEYGKTVDNFRIAANEFAENYQIGKKEALLAYRQLNYYYVEKDGVKTSMGDYMLNFPEKNDDFVDILFKGNPNILNNIRILLAMGVSDGGALIERIKAAVKDETVYTKAQYFEDAKELVGKTQQLKKLFDETNEKFDEIEADPDLTEEEKETALIMPRYTLTLIMAFEQILEDIPCGNGGNYGEYFNKKTVTDYSVFYPIVDAMTPGQKAMAISGQLHSVLVYNAIEKTDEELEEALTSLEETYEPMSVYLGTDMNFLEGAVGVTSDALREEAATGNQWASGIGGNMASEITAAVLLGAGGAILLAVSATMLWDELHIGTGGAGSGDALYRTVSFDWGKGGNPVQFDETVGPMFDDMESSLNSSFSSSSDTVNSVQTATAVNSTSTASTATIVLSGIGVALGIVMIVLSIYSIVQIIDRYNVEYTAIPSNMVDTVETVNGNRYVNYQVVNALYKDGDKTAEKPGDTNGYDGEQWNALYFTKSYEAGKCLTANGYFVDSASNFGKYTPVAKFGATTCYDLNAYNGNENGDSIFMAFGNSKNKKTAETSVPTVVGSIFSNGGAIAISGVAGVGIGMALMAVVKRKKQKPEENNET